MTQSSKKNRIIFIDLMRAFAVLQMVQGHTIDVVLSNEYRNLDIPLYAAWLFMRGMTAPIFLFTAGTVFTYLFRLVNKPFKLNPRVKKGLKRIVLLVFLGYMMRYPTSTLVIFSNVLPEQWKVFFAVDVLQLIGFGILFVLMLAYLSERFNIHDNVFFTVAAVVMFALYPVCNSINWANYLPLPIADYLYNGGGSNFPLFPWAGYVIAGGILGSYLAKNPFAFKTAKFSVYLALAAAILFALAAIGNIAETAVYGKSYLWTTSPNLIFLRLGFVLLLNSIVSFISLRVTTIPKLLILIGRNTLLIYVIHLIILYGSAWNPGIILLFDKSFNAWQAVGFALLMILLMIGMVMLINKFKIKNKQLVT